jgi:hypothetical protein
LWIASERPSSWSSCFTDMLLKVNEVAWVKWSRRWQAVKHEK